MGPMSMKIIGFFSLCTHTISLLLTIMKCSTIQDNYRYITNNKLCACPKWRITFIDFNEFRKSDKLLKYELGSTQGSCLLPVSCWLCDNNFRL